MPEAWEVQETQSVGDCADCCEECTPDPCNACDTGEGLASSYPWCFTILNFPNIFTGGGGRGILKVEITGGGPGDQAATFNGAAVAGLIGINVGFACVGSLASFNLRIVLAGSDQLFFATDSEYFKCDPLAVSWLGMTALFITTPTMILADYPDAIVYLEADAC